MTRDSRLDPTNYSTRLALADNEFWSDAHRQGLDGVLTLSVSTGREMQHSLAAWLRDAGPVLDAPALTGDPLVEDAL